MPSPCELRPKYRMRMVELLEATGTTLPPDVVEAFQALGAAQRGEPEMAMLRVQNIAGGGVINPVVEHLGDITHRMSHLAGRMNTVMGYEKVEKCLRWLSSGYGFERDFRENLSQNAQMRSVSPEQLAQKVKRALHAYAEAHAKLPVYNRAQWLARQAAIFVGLEEFDNARRCLQALADMGEDGFAEQALEYHRNQDGTLRQYRPGS